jgi:hypothetical protein
MPLGLDPLKGSGLFCSPRSVTILTCDTVENLFWLVAERFVPRFRDVQGLLKSIMGSWKETVFRLAAL